MQIADLIPTNPWERMTFSQLFYKTASSNRWPDDENIYRACIALEHLPLSWIAAGLSL
jgi:hypothetical protein